MHVRSKRFDEPVLSNDAVQLISYEQVANTYHIKVSGSPSVRFK